MAQQDISKHRFTDGKLNLRRFHQAKWDEPIIFELSCEGQRASLSPRSRMESGMRLGMSWQPCPKPCAGSNLLNCPNFLSLRCYDTM